jgi:thioredoxin-like negative regulator of GroEL
MVRIIKFWASWCRPCTQFTPIFEEIQAEYENFSFSEINIEEHPFTTTEYSVTTVPTVVVLDEGGKELDRISGIISKPKLRKFLDQYK